MSEEFKDIPVLDVDYHLREYDDIVVRLNNVGGFDELAELCSEARSEIIKLRNRIANMTHDAGGIMDMKQTIANKESEVSLLQSHNDTLIEKNNRLVDVCRHLTPEKFPDTYYIHAGIGKKDDNGMPEKLLVVPAYGVDFSYVYEYTGKTTGPEW